MTFTSLLVDTCTIRRNTIGAADAYGTPTASWANHLEGQACRIYGVTPSRGAGREVYIGAKLVVADKLMMIGDIDITEQDRVVSDGITYEVLMITLRQDGQGSHHNQCWLKTVR